MGSWFRQLRFLSYKQKEVKTALVLQQPICNESEDREMDARSQKKVKTALDILFGEEESTSDYTQGFENIPVFH